MKRGVVIRATRSCALVGLVLCPMGARADASSLSFPVVLPEGRGLPVRMGPGSTSLRGPWWYGWLRGQEPVLCPPSRCTPPPGVDAWRVYPQTNPGHWQAGVFLGTSGQPVSVSEVDWSDTLENTTWSTAARVRVEATLYTVLDEPLPAYEMLRLPEAEGAWGVRATNEEPSRPLLIESGDATVITPCARLTVQKLVASGEGSRPRDEAFRWNAVAGEWTGAAATLVNQALWERGTERTGLAAGVDARGKALLRYDWEPGQALLPSHVSAAGWYRLTLSLDGSVAGGKRCGSSVLNTSVTEAEVEAGEPYRAVIDAVWNLTYVDVYIRQEEEGHSPS